MITMEFHNKLYQLRKQKGLSQEELANRLNVSRQTVSKWEVGDSTPDMEKLVAISDLFEISLDKLVKGEETVYGGDVSTKLELVNELKEKAKQGVKIAAIVFGIILLIDVISMIVYFSFYGIPK